MREYECECVCACMHVCRAARFHREMIKATVGSLTEDEALALGKALNNMISFFKVQCLSDEN